MAEASVDLLRQFYGLDDDEAPENPGDIDGKAFEPEPYFQRLVTSKTVSQLNTECNKIQNEIIQLDSRLQNMVYDNYTKFLQASETVHSMKDGLSSLSAQMKVLNSGLSKVSAKAAEIRKDLGPNREKIQEYVGISRLLERIEFISKLPSKLQAHVDHKNFESAVDIWLSAEKVLETQTHYESFGRIRTECIGIIQNIKTQVQVQMMNEETTSEENMNCVVILIKMQEPAKQLLPKLIEQRKKIDLKLIESVQRSENVFEVINSVNENIVNSCLDFIRSYQSTVLRYSDVLPDTGDREETMDKFLKGYRQDLFKQVTKLFTLEQVCKLNCEDFTKFVMMFSDIIGPIGLFQQKMSFTQWILQKYIISKFNTLVEATINMINTSNPTETIDETFNEVISHFKRESQHLVNDFEVLVRNQPDTKIQILNGATQLFDQLLKKFVAIDPRYALLTFGLTHHFGLKMIPFVFELVSRFDPQSPLLEMSKTLQNDAAITARKCLMLFINNKRKMLSQIIEQGMIATNWLEALTPHDVSTPICLVIEELTLIWGQLDRILGRVNDNASSHSSRSSRNVFSAYSGSVLSGSNVPSFHGLREDNIHQIDRLFATVNRLHLGKEADIECKSVISAIGMYALKTMLEFIRSTTFSCAGFNQMQVDAFFIYQALNEKIEDTALFNALIEELLSSATDRTVDPIPFKMVVLQTIYSRSDHNAKT
ncbi:hypothetical protein TRFO_28553 [Tritrichomonas foetus]|uniref:Vacuolar protein sorting-associated protein 51 homolog n=1 Tax=Tritrichomonas foetus TaxID=1144522 RepID=A0A1J4K2Q6_9EUKA|nr:hypothetical protein TRFO_28553 [Tritrichomonas foetus]|eukprot:OHT04014.1 hypothetical protein TRFO_28553 [Tritrichomonas foetus]